MDIGRNIIVAYIKRCAREVNDFDFDYYRFGFGEIDSGGLLEIVGFLRNDYERVSDVVEGCFSDDKDMVDLFRNYKSGLGKVVSRMEEEFVSRN